MTPAHKSSQPKKDAFLAPNRLSEAQAASELERLAQRIARADFDDYQNDRESGMTDAEYDRLHRRNELIEKTFPALVRPDSPSRRLGAPPADGFQKVRHAEPMLSLDKAFDPDEVNDFRHRVLRFLKRDDREALPLLAEPKIDGLSLVLTYERGLLVRQNLGHQSHRRREVRGHRADARRRKRHQRGARGGHSACQGGSRA